MHNETDEARLILLVDLWHPELQTDEQRLAVRRATATAALAPPPASLLRPRPVTRALYLRLTRCCLTTSSASATAAWWSAATTRRPPCEATETPSLHARSLFTHTGHRLERVARGRV